MTDPIAPIRAAIAGRYEIQREIGQGAFATVYLARDLRHDRNVAFKILNADPTSETGELRFLREIRVLAKLQHPNILPLIDSGHAEAMLYYVMPYVSGETLRGRLDRERQLPLDAAIGIARDTADALAYAHEQGIIHRDMKPENILLSAGHPVIADFGIARAIDIAGVRQLTRTGFGSPGTPAYMSPEQLMQDREVDRRTDIYSLGCVLYEMLIGKPPFSGKDGFVRRFTEAPPEPSKSRARIPASIDAVVTKALARDPNDRYATAAELAHALRTADLSTGVSAADAVAPAASATGISPETSKSAEFKPALANDSRPTVGFLRRRPTLRVVAVAGALLALVAVVLAWPAKRTTFSATGPLRRWEIVLPDSAPLAFVGVASLGIGRPSLAISPDGNRVVYVGRHGASTQLFIRDLDKLTVTQVRGTDGAYLPFFSPEGRWVAYFDDPFLKKVSVEEGQVVTLARVNEPMGGAWSADGRILVADDQGTKPGWIPDGGGVLAPIPVEGGTSHQWRYPQLLPDGQWALHSDWDGSLSLSSIKTGQRYAITTTGLRARDSADVAQLVFGTNPVYVPSGHILYMSTVGGVLMALPFDATQRKVLGRPAPVADGIRQEAEAGAGQFAVGRDGTFIYAPGVDAAQCLLVVTDSVGKPDTLGFPAADYHGFELSPNGKEIVIRIQSATGSGELWVLDIEKGSQTRIRTNGIPLYIPRWWPDGKRVLFSEFTREGGLNAPFVRQTVDGLIDRDTLVRKAGSAVPSPDGRHLAVAGWSEHPGLWLISVDGATDPPRRLVSEDVYFTSFSPDGKWIVYAAPNPAEIYASSVDQPRERYKISSAGGEEPLWSPKGNRIVYRNGDQWMAVDVSTANGFHAGKARVMFQGPYLNVPGWSHSFFPDGERQLMLLGPQAQTSTQLISVTNWFAELDRLAPRARD